MNLDPVERGFVYRQLLANFNDSFGQHPETRWRWLVAAHIVGQYDYRLHMDSHLKMLEFAFLCRDWREMSGQLFRLMLVPVGHLSGKLPAGNIGRATVDAFKPMPLDEISRELILAARLEFGSRKLDEGASKEVR